MYTLKTTMDRRAAWKMNEGEKQISQEKMRGSVARQLYKASFHGS